MKALRAAASLLLALAAASCGARPEGDFQGVGFFPTATVMAVADRHVILERGGALAPALRAEGGRRLHLLFTGAIVDPGEDWGRWPAARLLEAKTELAIRDGILLTNIPLQRASREALTVALDETGTTGRGAFEAAVVVAPPPESELRAQSLGDEVTVRLVIDALDEQPRGGSVVGRVEVKRNRAPGQDGEVATGEVTIHFTAPLLPERLAEANFAIAAPVMACAAMRGPSRAGGCRDEEPLPYLDETGLVAGR